MFNLTNSKEVLFWTLNGYGPTTFDLLINILLVIIALVTILLNSVVLDTLRRQRHLLNPSDIFLVSIALADVLSGFILIYIVTYNVVNYQNLMECRFRWGLLHLLATCSVLHLVALTVDRYIKIAFTYQHQNIFKTKITIYITLFIWLLAFILSLIPIMGWNQEPSENDLWICTYFGVHDVWYLVFNVVVFLAPVCLMAVLYLHIFKIAYRHARVIHDQGNAGSGIDRSTWKMTKTILMITGIYVIIWIPTGILIILKADGRLEYLTTLELSTLLMYISASNYVNPIVNPIVYAFRIRAVKLRFYKIFCRKRFSNITIQELTEGTAPANVKAQQTS